MEGVAKVLFEIQAFGYACGLAGLASLGAKMTKKCRFWPFLAVFGLKMPKNPDRAMDDPLRLCPVENPPANPVAPDKSNKKTQVVIFVGE